MLHACASVAKLLLHIDQFGCTVLRFDVRAHDCSQQPPAKTCYMHAIEDNHNDQHDSKLLMIDDVTVPCRRG